MLRASLTSGFRDIYFKTSHKLAFCFMKILFKLAITRRAVFSSKCTKNRLSARLGPDPLGSLQRSPRPLAGFKGATSKEGEG